MNRLVSGSAWLAPILAVALGSGCSSAAAPGGGSVARIVVGDADTFVVHSRRPVQLPVRTIDRTGREVAGVPVNFVWLSGDSIPVSGTGIVVCPKSGVTTLGATVGSTFARVVVRCLPVRSVRMAGPLDLVLGDSSRPLQAQVLGLDGEALGFVAGQVVLEDQSVVRVDGDRVWPLSAGASGLDFTVGDESAHISIHVYEEVVALDRLRPEQDHLALPLYLERGKVRRVSLPAGTWLITLQPRRNELEGVRMEVKGASCQSLGFPKGRILCLSKADGSVTVAYPRSSKVAELQARLLLRRTRA